MINVAIELVRKGRRVLAVDFDLEAPSLDTFDIRRRPGTTPGMIDFVSSYITTGHAPNVEDFVYESSDVGENGGGLWIMPSGAERQSYAATFAKIDWGTLYERHQGYLLFEDLKEQWRQYIQPDYVLIDSRTGHTDIGGICTRQLPDAVVILFFPNEQNLRGLTKVVGDIRSEREDPRNKSIQLHFVMSNVPDLDDEDRILEDSIKSFQNDLGFEDEPMIIHRYDSLSLLNQVIFTRDRPRSRLAREYGTVTREIMRLNPLDRDGALDYIEAIRRDPGPAGPRSTFPDEDKHLEHIETNHRTDGEVLFALGSLCGSDGRSEDAVALFARAIDAGYDKPEVYLRRASILRRELEDPERANQDALRVLESAHASPVQVRRALSLVEPAQLNVLARSQAIENLPPTGKVWVATQLQQNPREMEAATDILRPLVTNEDLSPEHRTGALQMLILASIATGRFDDAIAFVRDEEPTVDRMKIEFAFNYGMALWGRFGKMTTEPFAHVVEVNASSPRNDPTPNYLQCMAISLWAIGDLSGARKSAEDAQRKMALRGGQEFSCWRYLRVSAATFTRDTKEILKLIDGDDSITPHFTRGSWESTGALYRVSVPVNWPTHTWSKAFWEEFGRTVATFGFLEDTVRRAHFAISVPSQRATEEEFTTWEQSLESSLSESIGELSDRFSVALGESTTISTDDVSDILGGLKTARDLHSAFCHGTWTEYDADTEHATLRFFPRNGWRDHSEFRVSRIQMVRIRRQTVDTALRIINAVVSMGKQFPGSQSPGVPVSVPKPKER